MNITTRYIVICERATTTAGTNNLNLINIFTQLHPVSFPYTHPQFALAVNFDIAEAGSHLLHVHILGPNGDQMAQSDFPVTTNAGNWQVVANYEHLLFAAPGTYTFSLKMDDVALGDRTLLVMPVSGRRKPGVA